MSHAAMTSLCRAQKLACELYPSREVAICMDPYCGLGFVLWCLSRYSNMLVLLKVFNSFSNSFLLLNCPCFNFTVFILVTIQFWFHLLSWKHHQVFGCKLSASIKVYCWNTCKIIDAFCFILRVLNFAHTCKKDRDRVREI